ncbi:hypothetical protein [Arthrobacter nitrophenolicus]|uniref:Excalibur domain-containing protein n=1 Tax=Arthrobacter nitrophenolicus TaxID=683150 RepID=L8TH13_9MICC|nr:hypothetical protein [Arthrobacter nitrophenolicus]ELT42633.1 excalibur domain-containing protein [Arthrobacter nitrophenolicus]
MLLGALSSGLGGALVFLAISAGLTGLYVVLTGRRSWAWLPATRKAGAVALATSFALLLAGGATMPRVSTEDLEAAASGSTAPAAAATARPTATASAAPSSASTAQETGAPLDPETPYLVAQGVPVTAPKEQPAFATRAIDLLATLPIKAGRRRRDTTGRCSARRGRMWTATAATPATTCSSVTSRPSAT